MMTTYPLTTLGHIRSTTRISRPSVLLRLVSFCCCCQLVAQLCTVYLSDIMPEITQICSTDFKRKETDGFLPALFAASSPLQQITVTEQRPPCNCLPSVLPGDTVQHFQLAGLCSGPKKCSLDYSFQFSASTEQYMAALSKQRPPHTC